MKDRSLDSHVQSDLTKKMVFIAGPRQCGKTTLAEKILEDWKGAYYSWDNKEHKSILRNFQFEPKAKLWVFDELHKFRQWRNWLKGVFDTHRRSHSILVTGSAKLDVYSRGGDSLQGRYFFYRMHPFTLSEFLGSFVGSEIRQVDWLTHLPKSPPPGAEEAMDALLTLGGFPEPLLSGSDIEASRWRSGYGSRLVQEEVRSLEMVQDLDKVEVLYETLPKTVGSVLSINSLREDLDSAYETVRHWLLIFDKLYATFRIAPYGPSKLKAVKKEKKLYLWDWSRVTDPGSRFENFVALHLIRWTHWMEDVFGEKYELRFFRDTQGHQVDFILLKDKKPLIAIECKHENRNLDPNLKYLLERIAIPYAFQISRTGSYWKHPPIRGAQIHLLPASQFLAHLP
jgi:predicted AAA+ superfamily ATPase